MASKIQIRRDTASNWSTENPTLSSGEIAFVTDENKIKVGDGGTSWNSLPYLEADAYLDSVVMGDDTTGDYVETLIASDGISISGEGAESASVTITNTGVLSLSGTTNEIDVSASSGNITLSLPTSITVDLVGDVTGNADTASSLDVARNISLSGDLSGSASFDGGSDITINASINSDSVELGTDTTGIYVARLSSSGDGLLVEGSGESASVTISNTGVTSVSGTQNEVEVSASTGSVTIGLPSEINADTTGNASTASSLETARSISLGGDLSGSALFDGGSDITITSTVADDSHNHVINNVDGLQDALDLKAPLSSPALTGNPTAPTASASANSTQIATTAFVQTAVSNLIDGAPGALDTLNELAASLGDDSDFAGSVTNSLATKQPLDADLTAIAEISASATGLLKKDGDNSWSLDTNTYLTGNETITVSGDATGSGTTSISLTLANSGVSASTYGGPTDIPVITVDAKGRLTSVTTEEIISLPDQSGNGGKFLTTDGSLASWSYVAGGSAQDAEPASPTEGYMWVDTDDTSLENSAFPSVIYSPTDPSASLTMADVGTLWIDEDDTNAVLNVNNYLTTASANTSLVRIDSLIDPFLLAGM